MLRQGSFRLGVVAVVGMGSLIAGSAIWLHDRSRFHGSSGWFAYAPLSGQTFTPTASSNDDWLSITMIIVGSVLLSGAAGYALGRRHQRTGLSQPSAPGKTADA